mmetsp:Transcript_62567/g.162385  ORF Transcript_62567/g.162385 Transcript_62567/m.162385 type:complete len:302 (-) Transcript_62567:371-1276(-)
MAHARACTHALPTLYTQRFGKKSPLLGSAWLLPDHHDGPRDDPQPARIDEVRGRVHDAVVEEVSEALRQDAQGLPKAHEAEHDRAREQGMDPRVLEAGIPRALLRRGAEVHLLLRDQPSLRGSVAHGLRWPQRGHASRVGDVVHVALVLLVARVVRVRDEDLVRDEAAARLQHPRHLTDGRRQVGRILQCVDAEDLVERLVLERHLVVVALHHGAATLQPGLLDALVSPSDLLVSHGKPRHRCAGDQRHLSPNLTEAAAELQDLVLGPRREVASHAVVELVVALLTAQALGHRHEVPERAA